MCEAPAAGFKVLGIRLNRSQGRNPRNVRGAGVTIVRCRECGLIFPDPQPVPGSILDHYDIPSEDYWQDERIGGIPPASLGAHYRSLKSLLPERDTYKALDVGVGLGISTRALMDAGFEVDGIEPSPQFHRSAIANLGLPPERLHNIALEAAEFPEQSFDFVNFSAVLEHVYDPAEALRRCHKWLRPGGLVTCEVPSSDWLIARLINVFFRLNGTSYVTHVSPMHMPFHLYEFTPESFRRAGQRLGYEIARLEFEVCSVDMMPRPARALLRAIMARTKTGMQLYGTMRKPA
jgi:SAM-dependent methyltransferase